MYIYVAFTCRFGLDRVDIEPALQNRYLRAYPAVTKWHSVTDLDPSHVVIGSKISMWVTLSSFKCMLEEIFSRYVYLEMGLSC